MRNVLPYHNTSNPILPVRSWFTLLLCVLAIFCTTQVLHAQTVDEWLQEAAKAEAEGRTEDAASAYSGAAHEQMKNGEYEEAGDNFKKAAEKYRDAGKEAQAEIAEAKNAGYAYEKAAEKAADAGDHKRAAELSDKAAEQYDAAGLTNDAVRMRGNADYERQLAEGSYTGNDNVSVKPTGTGRTIGNIANISVTNKNSYPVSTVPQDVYIPAREGTQDYVGKIPGGIVVPPNSTVDIPVDGICTNPFTPPVGAGDPTTDLDEWVPVGGDYPPISSTSSPPGGILPDLIDVPQVPDEINPPTSIVPPGTVPVILVTSTPVPDFTPDAIPDIVSSGGFNPVPTPGDIVATWPGTNIPVPGTFNPKTDPETYARVIVDVVERIEVGARDVQESGEYLTPFTPDPPREYDAFRQHTTWVVAAVLTGGVYGIDAFRKNVHDQMESSSGVVIASLPEDQKEELESGISDLWAGYMATGVTAKVIPEAMMPGGSGAGDPVLIGVNKNKCQCGEIKVPVTIQVQRRDGREYKDDGAEIDRDLSSTEEKIQRQGITDAGHQLVLKLGKPTTECHCITKAHADAMEALEDMRASGSSVSKAIASAKAKVEEQKKKLEELDKWEKEVAEKRSINAESKLNILWKEYMPKERAREFDKDNKQGKRDAQLKELREAINKRIEAEESAVAAAEQPLKEKEAEVKAMDDAKKDCNVFHDSKQRQRGPKITVAGARTVSPGDDGSYTFSTSSLSFYVKVEYFCIGDDCEDTRCTREIKVTFTN